MSDHPQPTARRSHPPLWLVEGLDIVQRRRPLLLTVVTVVVVVGILLAATAPAFVPPVPAVGAAIALAGLLLGLAAAVALDATDLRLRGPRHVGAAGGELVAVLPVRPSLDDAAPLAGAILEARTGDGPLLLGLAASGRDVRHTAAWTDMLGQALVAHDVSVLSIDLATGRSESPGLVEVVRDGVKLTQAVEFEPGARLARLGAGGDHAGALDALLTLPGRLPRDLDVLLVALPTAASRQVVAVVRALDHVLIVAERDETSRVDLIAGLDALESAGTRAQVALLDDRTAARLAAPRPRSRGSVATTVAGPEDEEDPEPAAPAPASEVVPEPSVAAPDRAPASEVVPEPSVAAPDPAPAIELDEESESEDGEPEPESQDRESEAVSDLSEADDTEPEPAAEGLEPGAPELSGGDAEPEQTPDDLQPGGAGTGGEASAPEAAHSAIWVKPHLAVGEDAQPVSEEQDSELAVPEPTAALDPVEVSEAELVSEARDTQWVSDPDSEQPSEDTTLDLDPPTEGEESDPATPGATEDVASEPAVTELESQATEAEELELDLVAAGLDATSGSEAGSTGPSDTDVELEAHEPDVHDEAEVSAPGEPVVDEPDAHGEAEVSTPDAHGEAEVSTPDGPAADDPVVDEPAAGGEVVADVEEPGTGSAVAPQGGTAEPTPSVPTPPDVPTPASGAAPARPSAMAGATFARRRAAAIAAASQAARRPSQAGDDATSRTVARADALHRGAEGESTDEMPARHDAEPAARATPTESGAPTEHAVSTDDDPPAAPPEGVDPPESVAPAESVDRDTPVRDTDVEKDVLLQSTVRLSALVADLEQRDDLRR